MSKTVRKTFWNESKELISKCSENEILILRDQITNELNKRIEEWSAHADQSAKKPNTRSKR